MRRPFVCKKELIFLKQENYAVRVIEWNDTTLVNICDSELVGSVIKDDKIEMHISKEYFLGEFMGIEGALREIKRSSIINLTGKRIVKEVLNAKMATEEAVKTIGSTSILMIFKFS